MRSSWTESEKLDVLFQIIALGGSIPWAQIRLPEGRTLKAAQVMIDKEKRKVTPAGNPAASDATVSPSPNTVKKRSTKTAGGEDPTTPTKKIKTRRKKVTVPISADNDGDESTINAKAEESNDEDEKIKVEDANESDVDEV